MSATDPSSLSSTCSSNFTPAGFGGIGSGVGVRVACESGDGLRIDAEFVGATLVTGGVVGLGVAALARWVGVPSESADGATLPPQAASTLARIVARIARPTAM
jgi:hypothetical protein